MAALNFLGQRLGIPATRLLDADELRWTRVDADLRLASGDWQADADAGAGEHAQAQIELVGGSPEIAVDRAREALTMADTVGNRKAAISAGLTLAWASRRMGRTAEVAAALQTAAETARTYERVSQLRDILTEWADLLAETGDHAGAYELSREALQLGH